LLIIDDLLKGPEEAQSELIRRSLYQWYTQVACTRLQPGAAIVVVLTRWHQDDLAGRLLREHAKDWQVLSLAAIAEADESFRRAGEPLWPEAFPLSELEKKRAEIGGAAWASLYQQHPETAEGLIFKREWWQRYCQRPTFQRIVQSWDTAYKTGRENDFSVCTTWGVTSERCFYLLSMWRGRVVFPELKKRMSSLASEWNPNQILVEDKASGQSLIQELRYSTALPIVPIKVDKDKLARAQAVTPLIEAGKVFLPESAPWVIDYVDELAAFPTGTRRRRRQYDAGAELPPTSASLYIRRW
jgi:predicted phage terminase large subunit-like protein